MFLGNKAISSQIFNWEHIVGVRSHWASSVVIQILNIIMVDMKLKSNFFTPYQIEESIVLYII